MYILARRAGGVDLYGRARNLAVGAQLMFNYNRVFFYIGLAWKQAG
ncbi:hypothetical protein GNQ08_19130 [Paenibacillus macerans]|uniref:Uncharacterized protein n=1 Tax=Paenibacillus macerans TaxID=44252 RepID=A0A6N8F1J2_PAEMA|nr:hypothetical protein [Paenibacillus macerans]MED4958415.1 hypothetical protein [Paenibacillus macerans]MUG24491.1 hypothetical protein [Paenibacillus macerans]